MAFSSASSASLAIASQRIGLALAEATRACEATGYKHEEFLHTLAAAYAETGDFKSAVKWVTKAAEISPDDEEFAAHIKLFKSSKPLRDDAQ